MKEFYFYILQVNVALVIFYLFYRLLFVQDTFLEIRRLFLLTVVVLAFAYPIISLSFLLRESQPLQVVMMDYAEMMVTAVSVVTPVGQSPFYTWQNLILLLWGNGVLLLLARIIGQLRVICQMHRRGEKGMICGEKVIFSKQDTSPFSFFGWIFINPCCHSEKELEEIIAHEKTHVRQWHSLDMMLGELLCVFFWFNPLIWFFRKEIRQNLEFLADKQVVRAGYNRKNYQYHLLRLSHQLTAVQIVNNFNVSPLKKRIIMMNKKKTSKIGLIKYALLLPVTGLLIFSGNVKVVAGVAEKMAARPMAIFADKQPDTKKEAVIRGKVVDERGKPIQGVSVIIKSTNVGTVTMQDGSFSIKGYEKAYLVFSYVGKATQAELLSAGQKDIVITLPAQAAALDKVVVVGYAPDNSPKKEKEVFVVVEDMPQFPVGTLREFIARNVKYPVKAMENGIQGEVVVSFVVDKTGKVTDAKIIKSVDAILDKEALRVIGAMPQWIPGKQRGVPVDVQFTMPIEFRFTSADAEGSTQTTTTTTTSFKVSGTRVTTRQGVSVTGTSFITHSNSAISPTKAKPLIVVDGK